MAEGKCIPGTPGCAAVAYYDNNGSKRCLVCQARLPETDKKK